MNNLFDIITQSMNDETITAISQKVWINPEQTKDIGSGALSTIFAGLTKQASTPAWAQAITQAAHDHDSSILENLTQAVSDGAIDMNDGQKILGHIFGGSKDDITKNIAKETWTDNNQISSIMQMLAPIALAAINKQQSTSSSSKSNNLVELLAKSGDKANQNSSLPLQVATSLLDQDGDGSLGISDLISLMSGQKKSKGLLGGLLGGLIGGKSA